LILSQLLTLFTTPVIYLAFDRLSKRMSGTKDTMQTRFDPGKDLL
jgi:multidrug efflux pump